MRKIRKQHLKLFSALFTLFHLLSPSHAGVSKNPFSPKAYARRYWMNRVLKVPPAEFLLNKASPLTASDSARFAKLASDNTLSSHLPSFCKSAHLLCFPDPTTSLETHDSDSHFATYSDKNFLSYGGDSAGGRDSFKNYSSEENEATGSFRRYGRDSAGHKEDFTSYGSGGNVVSQTFNTYAADATGGVGTFNTYATGSNVPQMTFNSYSAEGNGREETFSSYSPNANSGNQGFGNYGKNGNGLTNTFKLYGNDSNVVASNFASYSTAGNAGNDVFNSYGSFENAPGNTFKLYGTHANAGMEKFTNYRDQSNSGTDTFTSYAKESDSGEKVDFVSYGKSVTSGGSSFSGYGDRATGAEVEFSSYASSRNDNSFKGYAKEGVKFSRYENASDNAIVTDSNKVVNKKWVEPGRFFRESMLKEGNVMPMPDIKDKMPPRAFLPRSISSKLPFSSSNFSQLQEIFHAFDNSSMKGIIDTALHECERAPSQGETKKCIGSIEDMIDFAISVLGRSVKARTTLNTNGSKRDVMIGQVRGINGGKVTKSVSCHQSLYPYLLYYCHAVPKVRVYEAEILDPKSKEKINHGVAICHEDTSVWSSTHGAFLALGPGPGKIEVCHWIFENDLTWTIAD